MEISNSGSIVTIKGNIKSIGNFQSIKTTLDNLSTEYKNITIDIKDSISITSSVIGYLTKLKYKNRVNITIKAADIRLYQLLDELSLLDLFNVKRSIS